MSQRNFPKRAPDDEPESAFVSLDDTLCGRCRFGCVVILTRRGREAKPGAVPVNAKQPEDDAFAVVYFPKYAEKDIEAMRYHERSVVCTKAELAEVVAESWDVVACQAFEPREQNTGSHPDTDRG